MSHSINFKFLGFIDAPLFSFFINSVNFILFIFLSKIITFEPDCNSALAYTRPIRPAPPVIIAVLPVRSAIKFEFNLPQNIRLVFDS